MVHAAVKSQVYPCFDVQCMKTLQNKLKQFQDGRRRIDFQELAEKMQNNLDFFSECFDHHEIFWIHAVKWINELIF